MTAGIQLHTVPELTLPSPGPDADADAELNGIAGLWSTVTAIPSSNHYALANL
jgi:hypothetical protein